VLLVQPSRLNSTKLFFFHEDIWGSVGTAPPFLTSALDGDKWLNSRPSHLTLVEIAPGIHWIGDWVGPKAHLAGNRTQAVRPISHRYTDWAIPAPWTSSIQFSSLHPIYVASILTLSSQPLLDL
jgi:hypothetical protein